MVHVHVCVFKRIKFIKDVIDMVRVFVIKRIEDIKDELNLDLFF